MNFKQKLAYTTLGAAISIISMLVGTLITTSTAQTIHSPTFDEITCNSLVIRSPSAEQSVSLNANGIIISKFSPDAAMTWIKGGRVQLINSHAEVDIEAAEHDNARITLNGGHKGNHEIKLSTRYSINQVKPSSKESRFFGISLFDFNKSNASRAVMALSADGAGGFTTYGPRDTYLWGSSSNVR